MQFKLLVTLVTGFLATFATSAAAAPACTAARRRQILDGVPPGFNAVEPGASAMFIQSLPLQPNCTLTLFPNGLPGIQVAPDASTVRNFALLVRQVFSKVEGPPSVDYGNGTTRSELDITTGILHTIAFPVQFHAGLIFNYDKKDCTIKTVVGILTIPTTIFGVPVQTMLLEMAAKAALM